MLGYITSEEKERQCVPHITHVKMMMIIMKKKTSYKCLCSGGDVYQPCGGESKDP